MKTNNEKIKAKDRKIINSRIKELIKENSTRYKEDGLKLSVKQLFRDLDLSKKYDYYNRINHGIVRDKTERYFELLKALGL